jgi:hypothetical protein
MSSEEELEFPVALLALKYDHLTQPISSGLSRHRRHTVQSGITPSGRSIVSQYFYRRRYCKDEFGEIVSAGKACESKYRSSKIAVTVGFRH